MGDKKIAFVIGHTNGMGPVKDKGAYSNLLESSEFDYWHRFVPKISHLGDIFIHDEKITSYTRRQKSTARKTKGYDLVFEFHFNNSANPQAHGCEALYYFSNKTTKMLGNLYCQKMHELMGIRNRGAKASFGGNGFGFLEATKGYALLLEPFFGSSQEDLDLFNEEKYVEVLEAVISNFQSI